MIKDENVLRQVEELLLNMNKELYINFESAYIESYMPDINYYIDEKVEKKEQ